MSKFCRFCGKPLGEDAKFCRHCGKALDIRPAAQKAGSGNTGVGILGGKTAGVPAAVQSSGSFYLFEFFKSVTRQSNIPVFIYLILNVFIISGIVILFLGLPVWAGILAGVVLYLISLTVALSPIGEWMLRRQTKCQDISTSPNADRLIKLFGQAYARARQQNPSIPEDVKLYITDESEPNAFATGRRTVCVTEGLTSLPDNEIVGVLGHEFGHLSHHDTDLILVVSVGNIIISTMVTIIQVMVTISEVIAHIICAFMGEEGIFGSLAIAFSRMMFNVFVLGFMWVWTKLGVLLVMKSSRENEFEADRFSAELGYGTYLCAALDRICGASHMKGLFANLASSHPGKEARITKLRQSGVEYYQGLVM